MIITMNGKTSQRRPESAHDRFDRGALGALVTDCLELLSPITICACGARYKREVCALSVSALPVKAQLPTKVDINRAGRVIIKSPAIRN